MQSVRFTTNIIQCPTRQLSDLTSPAHAEVLCLLQLEMSSSNEGNFLQVPGKRRSPGAFSKVDADALSNRIPLVGVRAPIKYKLKLSIPCRDFLIACHSRYLLELHSRHISSGIIGYSMVLYATRKFMWVLLVFVSPRHASGEIPTAIFS